jgi:hypothetical protein
MAVRGEAAPMKGRGFLPKKVQVLPSFIDGNLKTCASTIIPSKWDLFCPLGNLLILFPKYIYF